MREITVSTPAKINLCLDVLGKLPNGYHQVKMIMQSISLADLVTVRTVSGPTSITSNSDHIPLDERNIAFKAWSLMKETFSLPGGLSIHLEKRIPVEAGLAGGSTNAAGVLKAVNELYQLGLSIPNLQALGAKLGADVPFCICGGTALAEGIGINLTSLPALPKTWLVLVNPGFGVSTAEIYRNFSLSKVAKKPDVEAMISAINRHDVTGVIENMGNVLETVTLALYPELQSIKDLLTELGGHPLMSGSGPTIFAITANREQAEQIASQLRNKWKTVLTAHTLGNGG